MKTQCRSLFPDVWRTLTKETSTKAMRSGDLSRIVGSKRRRGDQTGIVSTSVDENPSTVVGHKRHILIPAGLSWLGSLYISVSHAHSRSRLVAGLVSES